MDTTRELVRPTITRPLRGLWNLVREMNRIADTTTYDALVTARAGTEAWRPTTDVFARGSDVVIRCELAGVRREDVSVTYTGGGLVITGRCHDEAGNGAVRHRSERCTGGFRREIALAPDVSGEDVHAEIEDGLLEITVGRAAAPPEHVSIPVGSAAAVPAPRRPLNRVPATEVAQEV